MTVLRCSVAGCTARLDVPAEHVPNLTAAGGWRCQSCRVAALLEVSP